MDLHGQIMNIQAADPGLETNPHRAYTMGFRDARHAAAKLALGANACTYAPTRSEPQQSRTQRIRNLQAELSALLSEEAKEACNDMAAVQAQCVALANAGRHIGAIKLCREKSGLSLRESQHMVLHWVASARASQNSAGDAP